MKKILFTGAIILAGIIDLSACSAPHQPLKVHSTPGQVQRPNGCIMQAGHCKPVNT